MNASKQLIVVVEDDAGMRRALQRLLHAAGFDTMSFESAEALVSANCVEAASCLVLDVQLPGASGPKFYEQLGAGRPAVFITSHDNPLTRSAVQGAGGIELLTKPFVAKDLLDAISRAIGRGAAP
ncbi:response regulator transcription factor [Caballeronia sp. TF1N1]|uniref:response regulator transcription factor n=1 Tax=Caballeronia sp. TF1N1 TaxID=2878153 RepID=UPI001FD17E4C|nr:response regulator [Caballeronia sp. TF1N1]